MRFMASAAVRVPGAILAALLILAIASPARAQVTIDPSSLNFGSQAVGAVSAPVNLTLTNSSSRRVSFSGVFVSSPVFIYSGPARSFTINAHDSLTVSVAFRPNTAQDAKGRIIFRRSFGGWISVALSGSGAGSSDSTSNDPTETQPPQFTAQPASRTVPAGQSATFMVSVSGQSPFRYQWFKNGAAIRGATSSTFTTQPATTRDNGSKFAVTVSNSDGAANSSPATLTVDGGTLSLSLNPGSLSFGNVTIGTSSTKQATLTNSGTSNVTVSGLSLSGAGFSASGVGSGQVMAPGQSATIQVTFQPSASGNANGAVTVASDAAPLTLGLAGAGVQLVTHAVNLSWTPSTSSVVGYQVYGSQVSGGPYARLTQSAVPISSYTDSSVQTGKTYYYVVTSVASGSVESAYSEQATAVVQ